MLMDIAKSLIMDKLGDSIDADTITNGLSSLMGDNGSGDLNIASLVSSLGSSDGMGDLLGSWLGDGVNLPMDKESIAGLFDSDKLEGFASALGLDSDSASSLLADVVPNMVDKSSSGGSLLDSVGGIDGVMSFAKKFF